mgnify:FL=1
MNERSNNTEAVKFSSTQLSTESPSPEAVEQLCLICNELDSIDLLAPYEAPAPIGSNGNLSYRKGDTSRFIVTATRLDTKRDLQPDAFVDVDRYELYGPEEMDSTAYFHGQQRPSSESILHWYFYQLYAEVNAIIHVHENTELLYSKESRSVWEELGIIETNRYGDAGTVDLPRTVDEVFTNLNEYVVLKDHYPEWDTKHTGTVVFAENLDHARDRIIQVHEGLSEANR